MSQLLKLENIEKSFPGVKALSEMNFDLRSGEVHSICGENGAGKSTLMKVITGVYRQDSGKIVVCGDNVCFECPMDAFDKGVSIIYQETSLFEEMTVLENLFIGHEIQKKVLGINVNDYKAMEARAVAIFKELDCDILCSYRIKDLGMAQKQMVEIAKALTFDSKILILDEPTASLTEREVVALFKIIRKMRDKGVGIVYISHRLEEIFELCDRVTVIRDGKYISTKNVCDTTKDVLVSEMVGRSMDNYYPKTETEIGEEIFKTENICVGNLVKDVSVFVKKGEIVGFAGLAGSGRTEFAEAVCGLRNKTGEIYVENVKKSINNYNDSMEAGIIYVSEDRGKYGVILDLSILQNITLPQVSKLSSRFVIDTKKEKYIADKYIHDMGIKAPSCEFQVKNLSGGNQQKVAVSKALALNPKLLILDEPTRGVDVNAKAEIHKIISQLTSLGLTIIMISSELPELIGMCDRIYVMKSGKIGACFDREHATQEKILKVALEVDKDFGGYENENKCN